MTRFRGSFAQGAALWRAGDFGEPSPTLTWQQHHAMPIDPHAATDAAERDLRDRGTITPRGPSDELWDLLTVFAQADLETDLKFAPSKEREVRVLVALCGSNAARWIIDGDSIEIDTIPTDTAFHSLLDALPDVPPAPGHAVTLHTEDLHDAAIEAEEHPDMPERAATQALIRADVDPADAETAVRMLTGDRILQGQIGAAAYTPRKRTRVRGRRIIEVIDKPDGRVTRHQLGVHTMIAPGDRPSIMRALSRLSDDTRTETRDE